MKLGLTGNTKHKEEESFKQHNKTTSLQFRAVHCSTAPAAAPEAASTVGGPSLVSLSSAQQAVVNRSLGAVLLGAVTHSFLSLFFIDFEALEIKLTERR